MRIQILIIGFKGLIGSLSSDVFERRMSTGSEVFSLLTCLDDIKFVFLSFFTVIEAIWLKICAKPPSKNEKGPLSVDVRCSRTLLLKLPISSYSSFLFYSCIILYFLFAVYFWIFMLYMFYVVSREDKGLSSPGCICRFNLLGILCLVSMQEYWRFSFFYVP